MPRPSERERNGEACGLQGDDNKPCKRRIGHTGDHLGGRYEAGWADGYDKHEAQAAEPPRNSPTTPFCCQECGADDPTEHSSWCNSLTSNADGMV